MKKYTLYSLFYTKNMTRLFYCTLLAEYIVFLTWWQNNPNHHIETLGLPLAFSFGLAVLLSIIYIHRLKHEKIQIDEQNIYYYKKIYPLHHVSFYPVEQLNNKVHILAFKADTDKTFIFSTFLQKKKYENIKAQLKLSTYSDN